jgi:hypothetical protein
VVPDEPLEPYARVGQHRLGLGGWFRGDPGRLADGAVAEIGEIVRDPLPIRAGHRSVRDNQVERAVPRLWIGPVDPLGRFVETVRRSLGD